MGFGKDNVGIKRSYLNKVKDSFSLNLFRPHPLFLVLQRCQLGLPTGTLYVPAVQLRIWGRHLEQNRVPGCKNRATQGQTAGLWRNSPWLMPNISLVLGQTHPKVSSSRGQGVT